MMRPLSYRSSGGVFLFLVSLLDWSERRLFTKINYRIQTDAVRGILSRSLEAGLTFDYRGSAVICVYTRPWYSRSRS